MHAGRCQTFEEVLGLCSVSGIQLQEPHSNTIDSQPDSIWGIPWKEAISGESLCVQVIAFLAPSEGGTIEAGQRSHSQHIGWVQHIDWAVYYPSIGKDAWPLPRCSIQRSKALPRTKCIRWCDLERALLQRCQPATQTNREVANPWWKFQTSNRGVIWWRFSSGASEAKAEVRRNGGSWDVTWR